MAEKRMASAEPMRKSRRHVSGSTTDPEGPDADRLGFFQRWNYRYEVNLGLYMVSQREKHIVNVFVLSIVALMLWCAWFYLPDHLRLITARFYYYAHGRIEHMAANGAAVARKGLVRAASGVKPNGGDLPLPSEL